MLDSAKTPHRPAASALRASANWNELMPRYPSEKNIEQEPAPPGDEVDPVEEADLESFPASDAPAWTGMTGTRECPSDFKDKKEPGS